MIKKPRISRKARRVFTKTPGGKLELVYKRRKTSKHKCASCGKNLLGVPNQIPLKVKKLPKSSRRPERIYGGYLCSRCLKEKLKQNVRGAIKK